MDVNRKRPRLEEFLREKRETQTELAKCLQRIEEAERRSIAAELSLEAAGRRVAEAERRSIAAEKRAIAAEQQAAIVEEQREYAEKQADLAECKSAENPGTVVDSVASFENQPEAKKIKKIERILCNALLYKNTRKELAKMICFHKHSFEFRRIVEEKEGIHVFCLSANKCIWSRLCLLAYCIYGTEDRTTINKYIKDFEERLEAEKKEDSRVRQLLQKEIDVERERRYKIYYAPLPPGCFSNPSVLIMTYEEKLKQEKWHQYYSKKESSLLEKPEVVKALQFNGRPSRNSLLCAIKPMQEVATRCDVARQFLAIIFHDEINPHYAKFWRCNMQEPSENCPYGGGSHFKNSWWQHWWHPMSDTQRNINLSNLWPENRFTEWLKLKVNDCDPTRP